jgi:hypothetical protein
MSDAASFGIPTGRRVEGEASPGSASQIRVLPAADERTLEVAQRAWGDPAQASDFEQRGKTWVDKAGTVYKRVAGNPLAGYDQGVPIAAYFVADGNIIFLREADAAEHGTSQTLGSVGSRKAGPREGQTLPLEQVLAQAAIRGRA